MFLLTYLIEAKESLVNADLMVASAYKFDSGWILG